MEKDKRWLKPRHKIVTALLRPFPGLYVRWKYGITAEAFPGQGDRPYLIIMNHQTAFDQFFVAINILLFRSFLFGKKKKTAV